MTIVQQTKKLLVDYMLRPLYEAAGNPRFSRPALYDPDVKLARYLNFRDGIFVELGANDGFTQSNTYHLEKFLGWRGLLIAHLVMLRTATTSLTPTSRAGLHGSAHGHNTTPDMEAGHIPEKRRQILSRFPWWMRLHWNSVYESVDRRQIDT